MWWRWIAGLIISLGAGWLAAYACVSLIRLYLGKENDPLRRSEREIPKVPAWLIGLIERLFFTVIVAFNISGAAVAMMVWMTVKMASNWNRITGDDPLVPPFALSSLLGSLTSMLFALIGGLICRKEIWESIIQ